MSNYIIKCVLLVSVSVSLCLADDQYTSKYDNIDLDKILDSKRLVSNYVQCLLGTKGCPPEGLELKRILPDALKTQCSKCTCVQRQGAVKAIQRLQKDYPDEWKLLLDKWDAKRESLAKFDDYVKKGGKIC
nr:chemosensory protein [Nilaparvata lugens]